MVFEFAEKKSLQAIDWIIIAVYFVACIIVGLLSKYRRQRGKHETAESYFLAGRSVMWWAIGPSLFASNIGSEHFVGLAGSGAATGIAVVSYEWQGAWNLLLLGYIFVPIYMKSKVFTMPEFLQRRFQSRWIRTYLTVVALISYVFTKTSVDIYAGSVFLYEAVGWNIYISAACVLAITAVYTLLGGLTAVIYTDVLQCVIMIFGAIALAILSFIKVGGYTALWEKYATSLGAHYVAPTLNTTVAAMVNATSNLTTAIPTNGTSPERCFKLTPYWGNMFRPLDDPDYPWPGLWITINILGVWYFCTDQVLVQRALGAKDMIHAKAGSILAGFLKILPMFIMVMPGMISRVLFPDSIACPDHESCEKACGNKWGCTNNAYPKLVLNILPTGLVGLMMAVMIAAVMSSLSSAFNSSATIFTVDVWMRIRPQCKEREKLIVGRVVVALLVGVSLCWLPIIQGSAGNQLFVYIQTVTSLLAPPIAMVFSLGIAWPGLTEAGALSGLLCGFVLGMTKFIMRKAYGTPHCGEEDNRPAFVKIHFMYYALIIFFVSGTIMIVVSFFTKKVPRDQLGGLTWSTLNEPPVLQAAAPESDNGDDLEKAKDADLSHDAFEVMKRGNEKGPSSRLLRLETSFASSSVTKCVEQAQHPDDATSAVSELISTKTEDTIKMKAVEFAEEGPLLKWILRIFTFLLIVSLVCLWVFYR